MDRKIWPSAAQVLKFEPVMLGHKGGKEEISQENSYVVLTI